MSEPHLDWGDLPVRGSDANHLADVHDDDATVIDSLVSQEAEPPAAAELPAVVQNIPRPKVIKPERIQCVVRTIVVSDYGTVNLLLPNRYRKLARISSSHAVTGTLSSSRGTVVTLAHTPTAHPAGDYLRVSFTSNTEFEWRGESELWVKSHAAGSVYWSVLEEIIIEEGR